MFSNKSNISLARSNQFHLIARNEKEDLPLKVSFILSAPASEFIIVPIVAIAMALIYDVDELKSQGGIESALMTIGSPLKQNLELYGIQLNSNILEPIIPLL
jgi:hypothetical protein